MSSIKDQEDFILKWCDEHHGFDALDTEFHEAFWQMFGGKRNELFWGAQMVPRAMRLAKKMYNKAQLKRGIISLGGNWQPGFPKWVWSYSVK